MHNTFSKYLLYYEQIGLLSIPVHIASNTRMPLLMPCSNSGNAYLSPASSPCITFLPISSHSRSFCSSALSFIHIRCGREIELSQEAFFFFFSFKPQTLKELPCIKMVNNLTQNCTALHECPGQLRYCSYGTVLCHADPALK